eukprot:CAMPEP_0113480436 /NCGR_PEP_ID=MMETSP0014_2-20120614/21875_1 /TAXON_ID=2857 /ORGANISM="Nitzschia sp." /LENGTH=120 /DNA_ID=CAMNT_0000373867 /DNA_START=344 /DNA_END=706 /DNA_ORIENTATION=- /assembly_acc=CAM_ASM_000159
MSPCWKLRSAKTPHPRPSVVFLRTTRPCVKRLDSSTSSSSMVESSSRMLAVLNCLLLQVGCNCKDDRRQGVAVVTAVVTSGTDIDGDSNDGNDDDSTTTTTTCIGLVLLLLSCRKYELVM